MSPKPAKAAKPPKPVPVVRPNSLAVTQHFTGKAPAVRATYDRLLRAAAQLGPIQEDPKKTSIHLVRRSAFAGVATRKDALILTVKAVDDIRSPRVVKREQASAHRWHLEIRLTGPADVDGQLLAWLKASYEISG